MIKVPTMTEMLLTSINIANNLPSCSLELTINQESSINLKKVNNFGEKRRSTPVEPPRKAESYQKMYDIPIMTMLTLRRHRNSKPSDPPHTGDSSKKTSSLREY
jgi:hypothetical protein